MKLNPTNIDIMNRLIGSLNENMAVMINNKIDCFFHPQVSLFMPSCGQCEYAVTPSHTHPAYTFVYYFQAVDDLIIEGRHRSYDLSEGKCLWALSPDIPHQEIRGDFQSYIAIAIDAELFRYTMLQYEKSVPIYHGEIFVPYRELLGLLKCFMLEAGDDNNKNLELLDNLAKTIVHFVVRSITDDSGGIVALYDRFEVDRAIAYMNKHFSEKIAIDRIADTVNLSASHFTKLFKSVTGETPMDYLNMLRLQKARKMLMNNDGNITEIAILCGFNSSSYFSTCFLEKYKTTPSAFRLNFLNKTENSEF